MLSFVDFLEEIERNNQKVAIPRGDVERLVERYGPRVRSMGQWNKTSDGSVEIPIANIAEVARRMDRRTLGQALAELRSLNGVNGPAESAAGRLIDALADLRLSQFEAKVERFQAATDPAEVDRLGDEISHELFD